MPATYLGPLSISMYRSSRASVHLGILADVLRLLDWWMRLEEADGRVDNERDKRCWQVLHSEIGSDMYDTYDLKFISFNFRMYHFK